MCPPCQSAPIRDALEDAGTVPYSNFPSPTDPLSPAAQRTLFPIHITTAPSLIYRPHARHDRYLGYTLGPDDTHDHPVLSHPPSDPPLVPTSHVDNFSFTRGARYAFPSPFHAQHESSGRLTLNADSHHSPHQFLLPPLSSLNLPQIHRWHSGPSLSSTIGTNLISHIDSPAHQGKQVLDAEAFLREQFNIPPHVPVNLDALPDPAPGERPEYTNSQLTRLAIYGHPRHEATLNQILQAIEDRFDWYRKENKAWRNSIRHLLSLESFYVKVERQKTDPGSGSYWTLNVRDPYGMKRLRKRSRRSTRGHESKSNPYPSPGAMKMNLFHIAPRGSAAREPCNSAASSQSSVHSMDSSWYSDGCFGNEYDDMSASWR